MVSAAEHQKIMGQVVLPKAAILIPARMESKRFPGKPLAELHGRSLLRHVYQKAVSSVAADVVAVVTNSREIVDHCLQCDMLCVFDQSDYRTGSDRCAGALHHDVLKDGRFEVVVNLQCDEPDVTGPELDGLICTVLGTGMIVTAACPLRPELLFDPNTVKVVTRWGNKAVYFSRQPLQGAMAHVGVYAFPTVSLRGFAAAEQSPMELAEGLEQLRLVYAGREILVLDLVAPHRSVNTPRDLAKW